MHVEDRARIFTEGEGNFNDGGPVKLLGITTSGDVKLYNPSGLHNLFAQTQGTTCP